MYKTHVRPVRDLRNNYAQIADLVKDRDQVIITNNGRGEAVLIGIDEYAQFEEFRHMQWIKEQVLEADREANSPDAKWIDADELLANLQTKINSRYGL